MDRKDIKGKMGLVPVVDQKSGFCYGVIRAIKQAETYLKDNNQLKSLGSIVHNKLEVERLHSIGIEVIGHKELEQSKNTTLLIRAHGEPPSTYETAKKNNLKVIDCTCPVVLKLQERLKKGYEEIKPENGTIVIFGKKNHAEVNGLLGQVNGDAIVVENKQDLEVIDYTHPITIFSQTTKDPSAFSEIVTEIKKKAKEAGLPSDKLTTHNTICKQVSSRHPNLRGFSASNDVILFVSGQESSNGKVLFETCKSTNPRSYKIERESDILSEWFNPGEKVGICGATSTPTWQLEKIAQYIKNL
jgi:4-hydroxy-3-methylbut-2-enyl diphosphate reductase